MSTPTTRGYSDEAFRRAVAESTTDVLDDPQVTAAPADAVEADTTGEAGNAATLRQYWLTGKGAVKIRWGTSGDFDRCVKALNGKMTDPEGYCAELHHTANGFWPGDKRNNSAGEAHHHATTERTAVSEATVGGATVTTGGRLAVRLIRAGWSLNNNHYGADVLRRDGPAAFPKGTVCYVDHATDDEDAARPAGSIRNLAAVLTSNARWDEGEQALMAEARLFAPWREPITDMADTIGMSIRAWVTGEHGERDGRQGFIVQSIPEGRSVDFVTKPAAGGGIVSVLESVGNTVPVQEARNVGQWLESRLHLRLTEIGDELYGDGKLTRGERIALSGAIGDALQAWVARVEADAPQLFERDLWQDPPEPHTAQAQESPTDAAPADTTAPVVAPAAATHDVTDGAPPTAPNPPNKEEPAMSGTTTGAPPVEAGTAPVADTAPTTTTESVARPDAATVAALEAVTNRLAEMQQQLAAVQASAVARESENQSLRNRNRASEAVTVALRAPEHADVAAQISPRVTTRVLDAVPATAEGVLDDTALGERITAVIADESAYVRTARAQALEAAGVGRPYGLGAAAQESTVDDGFDAELKDFFQGTLGLSEAQASIASKGRG